LAKSVERPSNFYFKVTKKSNQTDDGKSRKWIEKSILMNKYKKSLLRSEKIFNSRWDRCFMILKKKSILRNKKDILEK
jgi:hypothetical protein